MPHITDAPDILLDTVADTSLSIEEFLAQEQSKDLLRFSTAGSVDDGKSTLIGRLLYDSQNVYEDHVRAVTHTNGAQTAPTIDFAQLTDGLRAEREQGITIDVAYRYFSTSKRKFIIADTPGHEQYTRNMATGASTADLAIILLDARKGILTQSRRHAYIASLLGIPKLVAAINKMDLVDYSQDVFEQHQRDLQALAASLGNVELECIPVSALQGDNVVTRGENTPWYSGPSLLEYLETVPVAERHSHLGFRMPVQRVIRPHQHFRGFAGQISAGAIHPGDTIVALPSGRKSRVQSISTFDGELSEAHAPLSIVVTLEDELDISRGDLIASDQAPPQVAKNFEASLVWLHPQQLNVGKTYLLKHTTQTVKARVSSIHHRIDIETLAEQPAETLQMNAIGVVTVEANRALIVDAYNQNRSTGSFILIDPASSATVGAGMIRQVMDDRDGTFTTEELQASALIALGNRHTLAATLEDRLLASGVAVVRTRVQNPDTWRALLLAGVVTLVESDSAELSIASLHGGQSELIADPLAARSESDTDLVEAVLDALGEKQIIALPNGGKTK
ncbi:MAG TPA: sulfate adenylyltransferase subunit CysN [Acidisarcina sp.]|nr:sulfate adenylyltransferase subunit CysN [Acidisarcina sp.]